MSLIGHWLTHEFYRNILLHNIYQDQSRYKRTCTELIERGNEGSKWTRPSGVAVRPVLTGISLEQWIPTWGTMPTKETNNVWRWSLGINIY